MKKNTAHFFGIVFIFPVFFLMACTAPSPSVRKTDNFNENWKFYLGDVRNGQEPGMDDSQWRLLDLPHDWSIEGMFSKDNPAGNGGGALPGGIGWYRKTFMVPESDRSNLVFVEFDGVYRNSEVWINGQYLGKRPYGYSSFRYELTPSLKYGNEKNIIAVRVDNSQQPNSRWYSGSGIYRNVRLVITEKVFVDHWGTFITTPEVTEQSATLSIRTRVRNHSTKDHSLEVKIAVFDKTGKSLAGTKSQCNVPKDSVFEIVENVTIKNPPLWSLEDPYMLKAVTSIECDGRIYDDYETPFGIRTFRFDSEQGFLLNGKHVKINGVCNHHDLGCFGAAVNRRAIERQLEIMKGMGVNAIRTSHNPPAPELLDLCDEMGFIVLDEAFDMWKKKKTDYDYALSWDEWHARDLEDMILRDRNHPSVFFWSIGNEVLEQWEKNDSSGIIIARELAAIVRRLDPTRPITAACNGVDPLNPLILSGALDLIGFNYSHGKYPDFQKTYPGKLFIGTETVSAIATRGHYDMPSDSIRIWPTRWDIPFPDGNPDYTCSAYDNCRVPWGSTHEETWKIIKKYGFLSGMFIWTGFDYLGEPTPYPWPSRSSYFGIVDLAGFPKDSYYLYQSEWTNKPVLHLFPHWNWKEGNIIDVWTYTNCEEVELFLNGQSQGTKKKGGDDLHLAWRLRFAPGTLKAVGRVAGKENLICEVKTAGAPAKIILDADRNTIAADGKDLSFITVKVVDDAGTLVPYADNLITFNLSGEGRIVGVDNGLQTSLESFKATTRKAFNGLCLAVIQSNKKTDQLTITARSEGLKEASIIISTH
jgi:beta-galactosidase